MTKNVDVCKSACPDPGSIPGVSTLLLSVEGRVSSVEERRGMSDLLLSFLPSFFCLGTALNALRLMLQGRKMSETLIIAILAIIVFYLLILVKKQRKKSRDVKQRIKNRAWRRDH